MIGRMTLAALALAASCGICHADERWNNFAEDADLRYYLDQKSVTTLPDNVYIFWVKSVAKEKEYYKREYNLSNLSYILTNYELDCAVSSYRTRGMIMFDKNRREINKSLPSEAEPGFEPVPPESMMELAQDEICSKVGKQETQEPAAVSPAASPTASPTEPVSEPPTIQ